MLVNKPSGKFLLAIVLLSILLLSVLLVIFFNNNVNRTTLTWNIKIIDSGNIGEGSSIALDSKGNPHISYCGFVNGSRSNNILKYAVWDGSNWSTQIVDSFGNNGFYSSIVMDSQDYPHISYCDNTYYNGTEYHLKYANWNGSAWDIQTVDSNVGLGSSIALDSANNPCIAYFDKNGGLKCAKWTGSKWLIQIIDSEGNIGGDRSIALDSNNNIHIIYSNDGLKYAEWDGSNWMIQTVVSGGSYFSSIALDSNSYPHVSYCDLWSDGYLCYASWNGKTWSIQTVDSTTKEGNGNSIALDSENNPHISCSYSTNYVLKYAEWRGSTWNTQTLNSTAVWTYTSICLDANDNPHISYFTNPSGFLAIGALNYATLATSLP
jgi:hypothetical protein